ncbi:hypothetical protein [Pedobacter sp.]
MKITRKELLLKSRYTWSPDQSPPSSASVFGDHFVFARHDGPQVLCMVNKLMDDSGIRYHQLLKIEEMLIFLPEKRLTHLQVRLWLLRNWEQRMVLR